MGPIWSNCISIIYLYEGTPTNISGGIPITSNKLAIIITLATILPTVLFIFVLHPTFVVQDTSPPVVEGICHRDGADYVIEILSTGPPAVFQNLKVQLLDRSGDLVHEMPAEEIYCSDYRFVDENGRPLTDMAFKDQNRDGKVTSGDMLFIRGENNTEVVDASGEVVPGIGRGDLRLRFQWRVRKRRIMLVDLDDSRAQISADLPNGTFNVESRFSNNSLGFNGKRPIVSRWNTRADVQTHFEIGLFNKGHDPIRNISIVLSCMSSRSGYHVPEDLEFSTIKYLRGVQIDPLETYEWRFNLTFDRIWPVELWITVVTPDQDGALTASKEFTRSHVQYIC